MTAALVDSCTTTDLTHHHVAVGPLGFWGTHRGSTLWIGAVSTLKQMQKHHAPSGYSGIIGRNVHKCLWQSKGKYERNVSVKPVEGILPFGGAGLFKCVSDAWRVMDSLLVIGGIWAFGDKSW